MENNASARIASLVVFLLRTGKEREGVGVFLLVLLFLTDAASLGKSCVVGGGSSASGKTGRSDLEEGGHHKTSPFWSRVN